MKKILLTLSYDGTDYHGWQVQPNAVTVQETLQTALEKLLKCRTDVTGCSRTDAGVHAKDFRCHLECDDSLPDSVFLRGLNSLLPDDIAVTNCETVSPDFHARYNAKGKTYVYNILNSNIKDPFLSRYVWQIERPLNIDKMNAFCERIIGKHDFFAFSSSGRSVADTVRTVSECFVERNGDLVSLKITGDGFLYNMVRIITGTAVDVSDGRLDEFCADKAFDTKNRDDVGITAPSKGLILEKVFY